MADSANDAEVADIPEPTPVYDSAQKGLGFEPAADIPTREARASLVHGKRDLRRGS
jgi:hypothetical protein